MSPVRLTVLVALAMAAFAGNSLLCRLALKHTAIDAASFTTLRLLSGATVLWLIVRLRRRAEGRLAGNWVSAAALFVYAASFSFAYISLPAAAGALILFGAVQTTMIGYGLWQGERLRPLQMFGLVFAVGGLAGLMTPGLSAPPLLGSALMLGAGVAWGGYSLCARGRGDPADVTAGNFLRTLPFAIGLNLVMIGGASLDSAGIGYALVSGALASGLGYVVWYAAATAMTATSAAVVQLTVPVIAAAGGIVFLGELVTLRLLLATLAILGGVALFLSQGSRRQQTVLDRSP
jgi:drug/metabolite transporter (DMT)-like permease